MSEAFIRVLVDDKTDQVNITIEMDITDEESKAHSVAQGILEMVDKVYFSGDDDYRTLVIHDLSGDKIH